MKLYWVIAAPLSFCAVEPPHPSPHHRDLMTTFWSSRWTCYPQPVLLYQGYTIKMDSAFTFTWLISDHKKWRFLFTKKGFPHSASKCVSRQPLCALCWQFVGPSLQLYVRVKHTVDVTRMSELCLVIVQCNVNLFAYVSSFILHAFQICPLWRAECY